jgi:hypothetical protein
MPTERPGVRPRAGTQRCGIDGFYIRQKSEYCIPSADDIRIGREYERAAIAAAEREAARRRK